MNVGQLVAYWHVGRMIVVYEQAGVDRAEYGDKTLATLSRRLTSELGRGFSKSNLYNMRRFYLTHQIFQTVSGKLSWSHYCELLDVADDEKRSFYEREAENSRWSVRELRRQMDSMLFERLLNAKGNASREHVRAEYALGGLSNAIFASTYTLRLPNREQLEEQVRRTIEASERKLLDAGEGAD